MYCGSANFTHSSLVMHHNILLNLSYRPLIRYCEKMFDQQHGFFHNREIDFYFLPYKKSVPLKHLLKRIELTRHSITLMLYSLTHPEIIQAIDQAVSRGVKVDVYLDKKQHSSYPIQYPFPVNLVSTRGLFHYKCGIFDEEEVVIGSANWSKNGFRRNFEVLVFYRITNNEDHFFWRRFSSHLKKGLPQLRIG